MSLFLQHQFDDSMEIVRADSVEAAVGPYGSYYSMLSRYMDFTPRVDRNPIRCTSQDEIMECVDAVTRLVGRKLFIYSCADAWFNDQWGIRLGTSNTMTIITFLYAGDIGELEAFLRTEGYIVNDIGVHP